MNRTQFEESKVLSEKIIQRIEEFPAGFIFTDDDFDDLFDSQDKLHWILQIAIQKDTANLRPLAKDIYYKVEFSQLLNTRELPPCIHRFIQAIRKKNKETIQLHGAMAANLLGLSTQVPTQKVFYTDGDSKYFEIAGTKLQFIHTENRILLQHVDNSAGLAISALHYFGEELVTDNIVQKIKQTLTEEEFTALKQAELPIWLNNILLKVGTAHA